MTAEAWAWVAGLLVGYLCGLWKRRGEARGAYIRGWCSGVQVTVQDLIDFTGAEGPEFPMQDCGVTSCPRHGGH